jgi:glc operon protein GlcG
MRKLVIATIAACTALAVSAQAQAPAPAPAVPTLLPYGAPITFEQARKAGDAALAEARKMNINVSIAVVDPSGILVYFIKMDDARNISPKFAQHKARVAATFKVPSKAFEDRVAGGGAGIAALSLDDVIASAGGIPILVGGKIVGAIGVGGSPVGTMDVQVAEAGLAALK